MARRRIVVLRRAPEGRTNFALGCVGCENVPALFRVRHFNLASCQAPSSTESKATSGWSDGMDSSADLNCIDVPKSRFSPIDTGPKNPTVLERYVSSSTFCLKASCASAHPWSVSSMRMAAGPKDQRSATSLRFTRSETIRESRISRSSLSCVAFSPQPRPQGQRPERPSPPDDIVRGRLPAISVKRCSTQRFPALSSLGDMACPLFDCRHGLVSAPSERVSSDAETVA